MLDSKLMDFVQKMRKIKIHNCKRRNIECVGHINRALVGSLVSSAASISNPEDRGSNLTGDTSVDPT